MMKIVAVEVREDFTEVTCELPRFGAEPRFSDDERIIMGVTLHSESDCEEAGVGVELLQKWSDEALILKSEITADEFVELLATRGQSADLMC